MRRINIVQPLTRRMLVRRPGAENRTVAESGTAAEGSQRPVADDALPAGLVRPYGRPALQPSR